MEQKFLVFLIWVKNERQFCVHSSGNRCGIELYVYTHCMQVLDVMLMMMVVRFVIGVMVVRAEFEDVRQRWEEEEQELQDELLCGTDTDEQGQQPHDFDLDDFNNHNDGQESEE